MESENKSVIVVVDDDRGDILTEINVPKDDDIVMDDEMIRQLELQQQSLSPEMNLQVVSVESLASLAIENDDVTPQQLLADDTIWLCSHEENFSSAKNNPDDDFRSEGTFSFTIDKIQDYKEYDEYKVTSPVFYVRMLPWRIFVLFRDHSIGLFLQCNVDSSVKCWSCKAIARFNLLRKPCDKSVFTRPRIKHTFNQTANDFGYSSFISWEDLLNNDNEFMYKNSVTFEVFVMADIPFGVHWDSKRHTGYVGLKNQGATCYMNSLLQALYFTNALRRAVYQIPTEADDVNVSVGLSLQRIFYDLQFKKCSVGTELLTKSFGWNTSDSLMQHDVQEFLRILLDKLETKMNGTCIEGTVQNLFEGKTSCYMLCKNVEYRSRRYETFCDVQLNIRNRKDIYEAFAEYIACEDLEGDNKYDAGTFGLQEAVKGVIFHKFPPVLHLHLLRFQYDNIIGSSLKNNDHFEFYENINLDEYLADAESTPADYVLQAVLVHSGDNSSGHYVVFISPKANGEWYKFDDDIVSKCRKSEAIDDNYGGREDITYNNHTGSSAYMLVYIRKTNLDSVLADITENEIPSELVERLQMDKRLEKARRRELLECSLYITISVLLEEVFFVHNRKFLFDENKIKQRLFKFKVTQTVDEMIDDFVMAFGVPKNRMRVWNMTNEESQYFMYLDFQAEGERTIGEIITHPAGRFIFLEFARPDAINRSLPPFNPKSDILLFIKYFNPSNKSLNYLGCFQEPISKKLVELIPDVNRLLGFDLTTELEIIDESTCQKIYLLNNCLGDVFCFHLENEQGHILVFEKKNPELLGVLDFFKELIYTVSVKFADRVNPAAPDIVVELSHNDNYEKMAKVLAERLDTDADKVQIFLNANSIKPIPCNFRGLLTELFARVKDGVAYKFYFEKLLFHIHELENKKQVKCTWISTDFKQQKILVLLVNKDERVKGLLEEALKHIPAEENAPPKKLVLIKVSHDRIAAIYEDDTPLDKLNEPYLTASTYQQHEFYIEELPTEDLAETEMCIPVGYYCKEIFNAFGVPFLIKACQGETYGVFMERLRSRLNVTDNEWTSYKFAIVLKGGYTMDVDSSVLVDLKVYKKSALCNIPYFGINHTNKLKRANNSTEKALKIYN